MKARTILLATLLSTNLAFALAPSTQAARPDNRDAVHDKHGQVVTSMAGNCVRTQWTSGNDECSVPLQMAQVQRQLTDEKRTAYFEFNKTRLMESERRKLDSLASVLKSMDDISGVNIVGYADRIGTTSYNERLSQQRAEVVEDYLRQRGYLHTTIAKTRWMGESTPTTQCPKNLSRSTLITCLQDDRRVTVEIQYEDDINN